MNCTHEDDEFDHLQSRISIREQRQQKERELQMKMELTADELSELIKKKEREEKARRKSDYKYSSGSRISIFDKSGYLRINQI